MGLSGGEWLTEGGAGGKSGARWGRSRVPNEAADWEPSEEGAVVGAMFVGVHDRSSTTRVVSRSRPRSVASSATAATSCHGEELRQRDPREDFESEAHELMRPGPQQGDDADPPAGAGPPASLVAIDKQGRVTLDEKVRAHARLELGSQGRRVREARPRRGVVRGALRAHRRVRAGASWPGARNERRHANRLRAPSRSCSTRSSPCSAGAPGVVVDATVGGGGHSEGILEAATDLRVLGLDRDPAALAAAASAGRGSGAGSTLHAGSTTSPDHAHRPDPAPRPER